MALAITPFQALCGFRPLPEIASYLDRTPELKALIPPAILTTFLSLAGANQEGQEEKIALKNVFASLMTAPAEEVKKQLDAILKRYASGVIQDDKEIANLVERLSSQFPGDVGIFCAFVLNYMKLEPGQAIFLGAGEPHAYVSGGTRLPLRRDLYSSRLSCCVRLHGMHG
jgi:mannose-6-phosphate isomerase